MLLSEMFGVERDVEFGVKGYEPLRFNINTTPKGVDRLYFKDTDGCWIFAKAEMLTDIIYGAPGNIVHLPPPLTDEQREQLRHIYGLGGRYLAKDASGIVFCYQARPVKDEIEWTVRDANDEFIELTYFVPSVACLVSWSDPEPLDIGKALGYENKNNT